MSQIDSRPKPEAVQLRSAPFPESGLLPTTLAERRQNLNVPAGDENAEKARRRRRKPQVCAAPLTASKEWIMSELAATWRSSQASLALLAFAVLLPAQAMGNKPSTEMLPAPVEGYNHTSANINRFSVNRAGGHNIAPFNSYGGSQSCCAALPRQWRPGLMATVEWEKDPNPRDPALTSLHPNSEAWGEAYKRHAANYSNHRAVVEIPQYQDSCAIQVHFLPCDEVRVTATCHKPSSPNFPYKDWYQIKEPKTCPK